MNMHRLKEHSHYLSHLVWTKDPYQFSSDVVRSDEMRLDKTIDVNVPLGVNLSWILLNLRSATSTSFGIWCSAPLGCHPSLNV